MRKILLILSTLPFFSPLLVWAQSDHILEEKSMKIILNGKSYAITVDHNITTDTILDNLPFTIKVTDYANHEYYGRLPFTPPTAPKQTSKLQAGHIYFWDGWNSFVLNYKETDIAPYQSVHIGEITDPSFPAALTTAGSQATITVEK